MVSWHSPSPSDSAMRSCTVPAASCTQRGVSPSASRTAGPGRTSSSRRSRACATSSSAERPLAPRLPASVWSTTTERALRRNQRAARRSLLPRTHSLSDSTSLQIVQSALCAVSSRYW